MGCREEVRRSKKRWNTKGPRGPRRHRAKLEKVLIPHSYHHIPLFFFFFFFFSLLSSCFQISPSLTSKCYLCKNSFLLPISPSLEARRAFIRTYLQVLSLRKKENIKEKAKKKTKTLSQPCVYPLMHTVLVFTILFSSPSGFPDTKAFFIFQVQCNKDCSHHCF